MTHSDQEFTYSDLSSIFDHFKPELNNAGWLPQNFQEILRGNLQTPLQTIPVLTCQAPDNHGLRLVIIAVPDDFFPTEKSLFAHFIDVPYLVRACHWQFAENCETTRILVLHKEKAWLYHAGRDQIVPINPIADNMMLMEIDRAGKWAAAPSDHTNSDDSPEQILARDFSDFLRHWDGELGPEISTFAEPGESGSMLSTEFLLTLCLCRCYFSLKTPGFVPELFPPANYSSHTQALSSEILKDQKWLNPVHWLQSLLDSVPAHWIPEKCRFEKLLQKMTESITEPQILLLRRFISNFVLLSRQKFKPETFVQALCNTEERHQAWKLAITNPIRVNSGIGSPDGQAPTSLYFSSKSDSPGRLPEWIEKITKFWQDYLEVQLMMPKGEDSVALQTDMLSPLPIELDRKNILGHFMQRGIASSFSVKVIDEHERRRFRIMLTAISMQHMFKHPILSGQDENLAPYWLGESSF